jgi:hypothetical protein
MSASNRFSRLGALALLCVVMSGAHAQAQGLRGSPRTGLFELRMTPGYVPAIDSTFSPSADCVASRPYQKIFGNDGAPLFQLGTSAHVYRGIGALSLGATVGYFQDTGDMVRTNPCVGDGDVTEEEAQFNEDRSTTDNTSLTLLPLQAQATYRFDLFEDTFPFVPVVRGGLDYFGWWIDDQDGETAYFDAAREQPSSGGTWGYHYTLGVHFLLDYLAEDMATGFDLDAGVNGSYLTVEYTVLKVDDFGDASSLRLGNDGVLNFGLTLEL